MFQDFVGREGTTARSKALAGLTAIWLAGTVASGATPLGGAAPPALPPPQSSPQTPDPSSVVPDADAAPLSRAILDRYCVECHNERLKTADLMLDRLDLADIQSHAGELEKVVRKLRKGTMPPAGRPRPDPASVEAFVRKLEATLDELAASNPHPGYVVSRRLNRTEYVNAISDLLGLQIDGEDLLPGDMAGFGFDNNAEALSITPALMDRYVSAATKISRVALGSRDNRPATHLYEVGSERQDIRAGQDLPFATRGGLAARHAFPLDGEYVFQIRLKRARGGRGTITGIAEDEHEIELRVDHRLLRRFRIGGKFPGPDPGQTIAPADDDIYGQRLHEYRSTADDELNLRVPIRAGARLVSVAFTNTAPMPGGRRGGLPGVHQLFISGPFDGQVPEDTPTRRAIFTCRPRSDADEEPCARKILGSLVKRAYRRPVDDADVEELLRLYRQGRGDRDFDTGIERALEALLSSPKFLFRVEHAPTDPTPGGVYRVSDMELVSRLAFFLWRSLPDEELVEVAARGELRNEEAVLTQQVRRMLSDRRATRFMNDFVGQWLEIRNLDAHQPDVRFSAFDDTIRKAMIRETELFFESQVRADRPILDVLRADYTYVNEPLAQYYGIAGVFGGHFRRVPLTDERRRGLLGHASVLTVTSYADRTSPVLRGVWMLETLLGAPPPPPPPNVPALPESDSGAKPSSLRERLELHRRNPACASCHARMDPLGFALENFDAIGRWRETDSGAEINSTITTLQGERINGLRAFRDYLTTTMGEEVVRTVTEQLFTFALGRGVTATHHDAPTIRHILAEVAAHDDRWSSLILAIVKSDPFQKQRVPAVDDTVPKATVAAEP